MVLAVVGIAFAGLGRARDGEPGPAEGRSRRPTSPTADQKTARAYHFGSQGPGDVFSNHTSHSNRLVPVYVFGKKADLGARHGREQPVSRPGEDQGDLRLLARKHGQPRAPSTPTRATCTGCRRRRSPGASSTCSSSGSMAWTGRPPRPRRSSRRARSTPEGKGSGLIFQDYDAGGAAQYGFVVTSPTHDKNTPDVDAQTVVDPAGEPRRRLRCPDRRAEPVDAGPARPAGPRLFQGAIGQCRRPGRACRPSAESCTPTPTHRRAPPR